MDIVVTTSQLLIGAVAFLLGLMAFAAFSPNRNGTFNPANAVSAAGTAATGTVEWLKGCIFVFLIVGLFFFGWLYLPEILGKVNQRTAAPAAAAASTATTSGEADENAEEEVSTAGPSASERASAPKARKTNAKASTPVASPKNDSDITAAHIIAEQARAHRAIARSKDPNVESGIKNRFFVRYNFHSLLEAEKDRWKKAIETALKECRGEQASLQEIVTVTIYGEKGSAELSGGAALVKITGDCKRSVVAFQLPDEFEGRPKVYKWLRGISQRLEASAAAQAKPEKRDDADPSGLPSIPSFPELGSVRTVDE